MKTLTWVLLALFSSSVFAKFKTPCAYRLAPAVEVRLARVDFVDRALLTTEFERQLIAEWVDRHGLSVVEDGRGILTGMTFDTRDGQKDHAYLLEGQIDGDRFVVDAILDEKKGYNHFRRLAQSRHLKAVEYRLGRRFLKCDSITVEGSAQIKIAMKHGLDLDEVMDFLANTKVTPVWLKDRDRSRLRYEVSGYDPRGRLLRVWIAHDGRCPNELISAFEVH